MELKDAAGAIYKDPKTGRDVMVWQMTATPDDPDFETFGDEVVLPVMDDAAADTEV